MNIMSINQFCAADTPELRAFHTHWYSSIYPKLDNQEQQFYDYHASLWDWAERYELWVGSK